MLARRMLRVYLHGRYDEQITMDFNACNDKRVELVFYTRIFSESSAAHESAQSTRTAV